MTTDREPTTGALHGAAEHFRNYASGHGAVAYQAIMALLRKREQQAADRDDVRFVKADVAAGPPPKLTDIGKTIECSHPVHLAAVAAARDECLWLDCSHGIEDRCEHFLRAEASSDTYRAAVSAAQPARDEADRLVREWEREKRETDPRPSTFVPMDAQGRVECDWHGAMRDSLKARIRAALAAAKAGS